MHFVLNSPLLVHDLVNNGNDITSHLANEMKYSRHLCHTPLLSVVRKLDPIRPRLTPKSINVAAAAQSGGYTLYYQEKKLASIVF